MRSPPDSLLPSVFQISDGSLDALNTNGAARGSVIGRRRRREAEALSPPLLQTSSGHILRAVRSQTQERAGMEAFASSCMALRSSLARFAPQRCPSKRRTEIVPSLAIVHIRRRSAMLRSNDVHLSFVMSRAHRLSAACSIPEASRRTWPLPNSKRGERSNRRNVSPALCRP